MFLLIRKLILDPDRPVQSAGLNDFFLFHGEMSWTLSGSVPKNKWPSVVPGQTLLLFVPKGASATFRPVCVGEYFRPQGLTIRDFHMTELQASKFLSADQAISLPGRSFHVKSFAAFILAALSNRRIKTDGESSVYS